MADFSQNITNSVNVFGNGPSIKWGQTSFPATMVWGSSNWGEGSAVQFQVVKYVTNSQSLTWDKTSVSFEKVFEIGTAGASAGLYSEELSDGVWKIVFTSDATNAEDRDFASWEEGSRPDVTFTCQAAAGTSWSEV